MAISQEKFNLRWLRHVDFTLLLLMLAIFGVGLVNLYGATQHRGAGLLDQQLISIAIGSVCFILLQVIDYRALSRVAYLLFGIALFALMLVWIPGIGLAAKGAHRWIGRGTFRIQPSEFAKIGVILILARHFQDQQGREKNELSLLAKTFALVAPAALLVAIQPDLSNATVLMLVLISVLMATQLRLRFALGLIVVLAVVVALASLLLFQFWQNRIENFLQPDLHGGGWQAEQSVIAIGSGRFWGKGFMESSQARMNLLPEYWTDFPFAIFGEEWGFVGCFLLLFLYFALVLWTLNIATQARDRFGGVLSIGVCALLFWQTVINVGMVTKLLPVMGVTLPLFSFGRNSVISTMIALGLVMNVSIRRFGR